MNRLYPRFKYYFFRIYVVLINFVYLLKLIVYRKSSELIICDIDNTIADTWKYLDPNVSDYNILYTNLPTLRGPETFIKGHMEQGKYILYLTARNPIYHSSTLLWLKNKGFWLNDSVNLIILSDVNKKLWILKILLKFYNIIYIDDLSFNHENGEVRFYIDLIFEVKKLRLNYIDYYAILDMQNHEIN